MTIAGACPGTVFAQLGSGVWSAKWTLLGGLLGALSFGYFHAFMTKYVNPKFHSKFDTPLLDKYVGRPFWQTAFIVAGIVTAVLSAAHYFSPWQFELRQIGLNVATSDLSLSSIAWNPLVAGSFLGLLQVPCKEKKKSQCASVLTFCSSSFSLVSA